VIIVALVIIAVLLPGEKTVDDALIVNVEPNDGSGIVDLERESCAHTGKVEGGEAVVAQEEAVGHAGLVDIVSHLVVMIIQPQERGADGTRNENSVKDPMRQYERLRIAVRVDGIPVDNIPIVDTEKLR
jgi:hypothetical protein